MTTDLTSGNQASGHQGLLPWPETKIHGIAQHHTEQPIAEYFLEGCTAPKDFRLGMEVEHLCVRELDGRRIPYAGGRASVLAVLEALLRHRGGQAVEDGGHLVGIAAPWGKVTLEPGGQVEWSSPPCRRLPELLDHLHAWLRDFRSQLQRLGITTLDRGFDTVTGNDEIPWIPKRRYELMRSHYANTSLVSYAAMGRTAGVHLSIDFADDEDWKQKFQAMLLLTPITVAIFGNSPATFQRNRYRAIRPALWWEMDAQRCQPPAAAFTRNFDIYDWARWIGQRPRLFAYQAGDLELASGETFAQTGYTPQANRSDWLLHLSTIFAPVRTNHHLEVRSIDMQPDGLLPAVPSFWSGLLYSPQTRVRLLELLAAEIGNESRWRQLFRDACRVGLQSAKLGDLSRVVMELAKQGLQESALPETSGLHSLDRLSAKIFSAGRKH